MLKYEFLLSDSERHQDLTAVLDAVTVPFQIFLNAVQYESAAP